MNLYDLMTGAQGGQGVNALANQFGISAQQTQAALQALAPAFSLALQNATRDPTGFGALLNQMTNGAHAAAYANPGAAAPAGLNANVLGQIFGSQQVAQQIGQQAAQAAGVNPQVVQQMMPLVASMLIGGIAQTMAAQGLGGMIAQLANAFASGAGGASSPAAASRRRRRPDGGMDEHDQQPTAWRVAGGAVPDGPRDPQQPPRGGGAGFRGPAAGHARRPGVDRQDVAGPIALERPFIALSPAQPYLGADGRTSRPGGFGRPDGERCRRCSTHRVRNVTSSRGSRRA